MITPRRGDWKAWSRAVRRKIRTNDELRHAYKAQRPSRKMKAGWPQLRFIVPASIVVMTLGMQMPDSHVLSLMLMWTCFVTAMRAQQLTFAFHNAGVLSLPFNWPVTDDDTFNTQRRYIVKASCWLLVDWLVFGFAIAGREGDWLLAGMTPLVAWAQWAASFAVALWAVRWFPRFPFNWLTAPMGFSVVIVMRGANTHDALTPYIDNLWRAIFVATPAGWIGQIWMNISEGNTVGYGLLFAALALAILTWAKGWQAMRAAFDLNKTFGYETDVPESLNAPESERAKTDAEALSARVETRVIDELSGKLSSEVSGTTAAGGDVSADVAPAPSLEEMESNCRERVAVVFARPAGEALRNRGAIERALGWFLNARERALIDILVPLGFRWSRRWALAFVLLLGMAIVRQIPEIGVTPLNAVAICVLAAALPVLGGRWFGFQAFRTFQVQVGLCVYAPAGFWEIARVVLKVNALQCIAGLPFILMVALLGFAPPDADLAWLCNFSLRILIIVLAAQPIWLIGKLSPNTTDSAGPWYYLAGMGLLLISLVVALVALFTTGVMAESPLISLGCLAVGGLITHTCLAIYGVAWNRGWFDLLAKQK